jgi:hypothetical protein
MALKEIPRHEWKEFFESFSSRHQGWFVKLQWAGTGPGADAEVQEQPLESITADLDGGEDKVSVTLGPGPDTLRLCTVPRPSRVQLQQTAEGADQALQIDSADGTTMLVRFRSAMLPEMVDGI